ncbi:MAG TPA: PAS domain S-box protein, partial [Balneolales bacterium]|nr:PAS domain S-box protein [Balneolales bacterium]
MNSKDNNKSKLERSKYSVEALIRFLRYVRFGYLFFTSLIIVGAVYGVFEILQILFIRNVSLETLRWLYVSRGVGSSLLLMMWAAWTVYNYRGIYKGRLQKTEERYRDIIESSADAILSIDGNNIIRSWNHGAEEIFKWEKSEIIGKPISLLIPRDIRSSNELEVIEKGLLEHGYVSNYETERLNKSGGKILVQLTETVIKDEKGQAVGRSLIMRDITEARMREKQLQQSERLAAIGHMAAGVAHEVG